MRRGRVEGRFDDVVGNGFVLLSRSAEALAAISDASSAHLAELGAKTALIVPADGSDGSDGSEGSEGAGGSARSGGLDGQDDRQGWEDLDDKYLPFMMRHGIETMLLRPDFYLYGAVATGDSPDELVSACLADLERAGLSLAGIAAVGSRTMAVGNPA